MSAVEAAKLEMEDARAAVIDCEREIQAIKAELQTLRSAASAEGSEEPPNSLEIALLKVSLHVYLRVFSIATKCLCFVTG